MRSGDEVNRIQWEVRLQQTACDGGAHSRFNNAMDDLTEKSLDELQALLDAIEGLERGQPYSPEHVRWVQNTSFALGRLLGSRSALYHSFVNLNFHAAGSFVLSGWDIEKEKRQLHLEAYRKDLGIARGILQSAIDQLKKVGLDQLRKESGYRIAAGAHKVFLAHGTHTPALDRIERYLRSSGFEPVIVSRLPSEGQAIDDLVEQRMSECSCAIILATKDDQVGDKWQPRPNVMHEIGLAQEKLDDRVIYLKESGCKFPSNVGPKVWESFSQDDLAPAFEKISRELHGFGLI